MATSVMTFEYQGHLINLLIRPVAKGLCRRYLSYPHGGRQRCTGDRQRERGGSADPAPDGSNRHAQDTRDRIHQ